MATPAAPLVTPGNPHQAWYARAASALKRAAVAVKNEVEKIALKAPEVAAALQKAAPTVEGITELVLGTGAAAIEDHAFNALGVVAKAIADAGNVAAGNGISISLDAAFVAEIKAIIPTIEKFFNKDASTAPPTPAQ